MQVGPEQRPGRASFRMLAHDPEMRTSVPLGGSWARSVILFRWVSFRLRRELHRFWIQSRGLLTCKADPGWVRTPACAPSLERAVEEKIRWTEGTPMRSLRCLSEPCR